MMKTGWFAGRSLKAIGAALGAVVLSSAPAGDVEDNTANRCWYGVLAELIVTPDPL